MNANTGNKGSNGQQVQRVPRAADMTTLITGGAGFIGTNVAHRIALSGGRVVLYDNLSRPGVERNVRWLKQEYGDRVKLRVASVLDGAALKDEVSRAGRVFHFAAQVAVTTSLEDPVSDFEINSRGTLNVLEAVRRAGHRPALLYTSTNKVYGGLPDIALVKGGTRYEPADAALRARGIDEKRPLECCSPYGCSKGCADQYVLDYARTFGLPAVVFRMSCIYGPHQFGNEDQGWVAHFLARAIGNRPIHFYGDGLQVRDILFVDDLVNAMMLAMEEAESLAGQAFNMGGGPERTISLIELLDIIAAIDGRRPEIQTGAWRLADQRYYVSDTGKFERATGWRAAVSPRAGIGRLYEWLAGMEPDGGVRRGAERRNPEAWGGAAEESRAAVVEKMEQAP